VIDALLCANEKAAERIPQLAHYRYEFSGAGGCATRPTALKNPAASGAGFFSFVRRR
jgi:hypothetical protein